MLKHVTFMLHAQYFQQGQLCLLALAIHIYRFDIYPVIVACISQLTGNLSILDTNLNFLSDTVRQYNLY